MRRRPPTDMTSSTRPSFSFPWLVLAATTALAVSACSSGDVAVGSSQDELKKSPSGKPTGDGAGNAGREIPYAYYVQTDGTGGAARDDDGFIELLIG